MADLDGKWQELADETANKKRRLKEAVQGQEFRRGVDDLNNWLDGTETRLANDDVGDDIPSVKQLLKKHKVWLTGQGFDIQPFALEGLSTYLITHGKSILRRKNIDSELNQHWCGLVRTEN